MSLSWTWWLDGRGGWMGVVVVVVEVEVGSFKKKRGWSMSQLLTGPKHSFGEGAKVGFENLARQQQFSPPGEGAKVSR